MDMFQLGQYNQEKVKVHLGYCSSDRAIGLKDNN